jgi:hypothetical protein
MARWPTIALVTGAEMKLLVTNDAGQDLIKARLPYRPAHSRAMPTLLEGVALWSGQPLDVAISAANPDDDWFGTDAWHEAVWPTASPLVRLDWQTPLDRAPRTIPGVGDFRDVRRQLRLVWSR